MSKLIVFITCISLVVCCGYNKEKRPKKMYSLALVQHAKHLSLLSPVSFKLKYGIAFVDSLPAGQIGRCKLWSNEPYQIEILRSWYESRGILEQDALLLHEIMHCEFKMGHILPHIRPAGKLMGTEISTDIQCLQLKGHRDCIFEALKMFLVGQINRIGS